VTPPKVTPVLQIGFTGHRELAPEALEPLRAALARVIADIGQGAHQALAGGWPGLSAAQAQAALTVRGLSALAIGADQLAAREVLAAGWPLAAPLPFAREIYRGDFTEAQQPDFEALLSAAATVYELDGVPGRGDAYRAVGHLILQQSDMLVAVWSGDSEKGPGGTAEVVRDARAADIPVVVIDSRPPYAIRLLTDAASLTIADIVQRLLAPPRKAGTVDELAVYYGESRFRAPALAVRLARLERVVLGFRRPPKAAPQEDDTPPQSLSVQAPFAGLQDALAPALQAADQLAVRYAMLYRASITLRWLAVLPSAFAALVLIYVQGPWAAPLSLIAYLTSLITFLVGFNDSHSGWHRRFLDYRFLAEHLRYTPMMAMFGSARTLPRLPPYQSSANSDWVNWYLRFALRKLGLVSLRRDAAFSREMGEILLVEIGGQISFYAARTAEADLLAKRLRFATMITYFIAFGLGFLGGMLKLTGIGSVEEALAGAGGAKGTLTALISILFLLAGSATIFGTIWPAISGFRAQREYFRLSQRYAAMMRQLGQMQARLGRDGTAPGQVERVAGEAVDAMLAEVSDWRVLIKARDFSVY